MDRLIQDIKVALRSLGRHRTFTSVAVVTLALGVGATTAIFSVVYGILLRPLPYVEADRLVHFGQTGRRAPTEPVSGSTSHLNFLDLQRTARTIAPMALFSAGRAVISHDGEADVVPMGTVTPAFFDVFKVAPVMGRAFTADEDRPTGPRAAIVSYGYWQERLGGRADVIGQSIDISGVPWPIVGVAPRDFDFPRGARLWLPIRANDETCGRGCVYLNGIGRLAPGVSAAAAQQEMSTIAEGLERAFPGDNFDTTVMVQTLHDRTVGSVELALVVLLGAVLMVLLIACANVANLVLVRGASRQSEIAVRAAMGAGRRGLLSYLLVEHLVLAVAGGALGLVFAAWGIDLLKGLAPTNLPRLADVQFDAPTFVFALLVVTATAVLFGLGPSLQLARVPLSAALGQRGSVGSSRRNWTRSAMLVAEVGLSVVLLLGAGLLLRSLAALQQTNPGFDAGGLTVFTVSLPPARYPVEQVAPGHERLDTALAAMPGVTRVARISGLPLGPSENVRSFLRTDQPPPAPGQGPGSLYRIVDPDYFQTLKIPLLAGRHFEPTDRDGAPPVVVVSRRAADAFWPGEDPIGRSIRFTDDGVATVVGIVANVRSQTLARDAQPEIYAAHAQSGARGRTVAYVIQSALGTPQVLPAAREAVRTFDSRLPLIGPSAMADLVDEQLARPRFYLVLLGLFAVLAIVLAAVGVYGVVAYIASQRTREIGVRMALGARRDQVVTMMLWQGLRPGLAGLALGIAIAAGAGRAIEGLLYDVRPHDPSTFVGVAALVLLVIAAACAIPARRASGVAPVEALRGE
jgi:putative ABC transport system permease protein